MTPKFRRSASLLVSTLLLGTLSLLAAGTTASAAGPAQPKLTATTTSLTFGEATLGTYVGPQSFTMTNNNGSSETVTLVFSGPAADDWAWDFEGNCPSPSDASGKTLVLAQGAACTVDMYFYPGALGARNATLNLTDTIDAGTSIALSGTGGIGYYQVSATGAVAYAGDAGFYGDAANVHLNHPIVGMAQTGDDGGYWLVASDGGIFNYGDAPFYGSTGAITLNKPIVGMAGSFNANGPNGYWLVASDGGIFSYGAAQFYGSTGSIHLNKPIVGMAATPDGGGYWLVASDGGIFSYGDARFFGSTGSIHLNKPIVGMVPTPDGGGYWLVASDGGIFSYGDAQFYGSAGALPLVQPIVGMAAMPDGSGYWFSAADGGLFNYGAAPFDGSGTGLGLGRVVGMVTDGVPTYQAEADIPAIRLHMTRSGTVASDHDSSSTRYFAGP
jgi:hypothetical protein